MRLTATTVHWLAAGTAEFLAVAVPAAVAAGVGAFVLYQGVVEGVGLHLQSLYTATEAAGGVFNKTAGDVLGLGHAFQTAQDAANPAAYELLGAYINIAKSHMVDFANTGLQVAHMLDAFSARVTLDMRGAFGGQVQALLANMVPDLQQLGALFGNLGHTILNLASEMPGLAEMLLGMFSAISKIITVLTNPAWYNFGGQIITIAMTFEEFYRWGGLALNILVRITGQMAVMRSMNAAGFISQFGAGLRTMINAGGALVNAIGTWVANLGLIDSASARAGIAISNAGRATQRFAMGLSNLQAAGLAAIAAALIAAAIAADRYRNSAQQLIDKTNRMITAAPNAAAAFTAIAKGVSAASVQIAQQERILRSYSQTTQSAGNMVAGLVTHIQSINGPLGGASQGMLNIWTRTNQWAESVTNHIPVVGSIVRGIMGSLGLGASQASSEVDQLTAAQKKWVGQAGNMMVNSANLGHALHFTSGEAMLLADAAGVKLTQSMAVGSQAFRIAVQQVFNLEQGYRAMGQSSGAIGKDMTALAIQAGLQNTQVQKLTQSWDQYMGLLTGGTSALSSFEQAITGLSSGTNKISNILGKAGSVTLSVKSFAESLKSYTGDGAQAWQNFNQVVSGSAQQFIDWMDNAAAVGMVTAPQLTGAIKGIVAQLLPFASKSAAARAEIAGLAQEAGGPATTNMKELTQWARQGGMSAHQLGQFVNSTTVKLSNMAQVAANLGTVLQSNLVNAFDAARMNSSGLNTDLAQLSTAISNTGVKSSTTHGDMLKVIADMASMHVSVPTIAALINSLGIKISEAGINALISSGRLKGLAGTIGSAGHAAGTAAGSIDSLARAIDSLHSKTVRVNVITQHEGIFVGGGGPRGITGHASGTDFAHPGLAMVGEAGPELMQMHGGERIYSNPETEAILSGGQPHSALANEAGGGVVHVNMTVPVTATLDGEVVWRNQQRHTLIYNTRNGNQQSGAWAPAR